MNKKQKELIEDIRMHNDSTGDFLYNLRKASEELQELSLALTQKSLKFDKISDQEIIDEIGDVEIRIQILKNIYSKEAINKRITTKLRRLNKSLKLGENVGI